MVGSSTDNGPAWDRLTGSQVGRFVVQSRLGAGGAAVVYQAYDQVAGRTVALKVLPPHAEAAARDRFRREALMAGALRHPNIVHIYQVSASAAGLAYIAMELVEGESLSDLLGRRHLLQAEESCNLLAPIAAALAHAHRQGVVHRDVKPSNILLRPASPGAAHNVQMQSIDHPVVPLLTDFGVARYLDAPELTSAGRTVGTPSYMAPEQCAGSREIDGRADIYALGTVLYRCVSGQLPFVGPATQVMHAQIYEPVLIEDRVLHGLSVEVVDILRHSLAKRREERYADAMEMALALRHAAAKTLNEWTRRTAESPTTLTLGAAGGESTATLANAVPQTGMTTGFGGPASVLIPQTRLGEGEDLQVAKTRPTAHRSGRAVWIAAAGLMLAVALGWSVYGMARLAPGNKSPEIVRLNRAPALSATTTPVTTPVIAALAAVTSAPAPTKTPAATSAPDSSLSALLDTSTAEATGVITTVTAEEITEQATRQAPTLAPTPAQEQTALPTQAEQSVQDKATATAQATSAGTNEEIVTACSGVVDEFFLEALKDRSDAVRSEFSCPSNTARTTSGIFMPFDNGVMLHLDESPVIYVYYMRTGEWEQAVAQAQGASPALTDIESPPADRYVPAGVYAEIWMPAQRRSALGYATAPDTVQFKAIVQTFPGGLLIGNTDDGSVFILERAKLRL